MRELNVYAVMDLGTIFRAVEKEKKGKGVVGSMKPSFVYYFGWRNVQRWNDSFVFGQAHH